MRKVGTKGVTKYRSEITNSLPGEATSSDVKKLADHIDKLYHMQFTMSTGQLGNIGKLESFIKATNSRMTNLMNTVALARREILNITIASEQQD